MLNKTIFSKILSIIILLGSSLCAAIPFTIDYEKYTLDNGLTVILHVDKSDPIVGITIQYHVGSNRETPGRTGFAHLFEHMLFQESQHIGQDQFFKIIKESSFRNVENILFMIHLKIKTSKQELL